MIRVLGSHLLIAWAGMAAAVVEENPGEHCSPKIRGMRGEGAKSRAIELWLSVTGGPRP